MRSGNWKTRTHGRQLALEKLPVLLLEKIDERDAAERAAILTIFAEKKADPCSSCRGPQHRVPKREIVILDGDHGVVQSERVGGMDIYDRTQVLDETASSFAGSAELTDGARVRRIRMSRPLSTNC